MKIKRFTAPSMRDAIKQVREEQGPDAVILSNRRVDGGIEVVAAVDYDEALMRQAVRATPGAKEAAEAAPPAKAEPIGVDPNFAQMQTQIAGMRNWLEGRLAKLDRSALINGSPARAAALDDLEKLGLIPELARELASAVPDQATLEQAHRLPLGLLAKRLPVLERDLLDTGGVIACVGPTGVGKTTTLAKLAARHVQKYGIRSTALITLDNYRIGAREQLHIYGRLLNVPVHDVNTGAELRRTLEQLSDCRLVLIDTAGMSQRDKRLAAQFATLAESPRPVRTCLVLAANSQAGDLEEVATRFAAAKPVASILTKLDETTRLGAALSVLTRRKLPLAYVCDGQRVPEDLHLAKAHQLVISAAQLARGAAPSTEFPIPRSAPAELHL